MSISEIEEGPQDQLSCLRNLAFQLILDGEVSQVAHLRRDLCECAGVSSALCSSVWKDALGCAVQIPRHLTNSVSFRFFFAQQMAHRLVTPKLFN